MDVQPGVKKPSDFEKLLIMNTKEFKELVEKRKVWVECTKANKFDFELLSSLYRDPSHFIYELLQNAEDAGAESISFNLYKDNLEIFHDAKNDFNFKDVEAVTGYGIRTKINKIGEFGIGFKSVYGITKSPIIESGPYHFQISDFVIPNPLKLKNNSGTRITLPFDDPSRKDEIYKLVENKLQDIDLKTLLFLTNIKEIKWKIPTQTGIYKSVITSLLEKNTKTVSVASITDDEKCVEKY